MSVMDGLERALMERAAAETRSIGTRLWAVGRVLAGVLLAFLVGWGGAWAHARFATFYNDYRDFQRMRAWVAAVQQEQARQASQR